MTRYLFVTYFRVNGKLEPLSQDIHTKKPKPYKKVNPIIEAITLHEFDALALTKIDTWIYEGGELKDTCSGHTDPPQSSSAPE